MASTAFETILAATLNYRGPKIYNQIFYGHPLSAWLMEKKAVEVWEGGGENIETNVEISGNSTFAARDYKATIPLAEQNPLRTASLPRAFVNGSVTWYQAQEEANQGKFRICNLVNTLVDNAVSSAQEALAIQFWEDGGLSTTTPGPSASLCGIPAMIGMQGIHIATGAANSNFGTYNINSYMGFNRATTGNEWWRSKSGTAFTVTNADGTTHTYATYVTAEPLSITGGTDGGVQRLYNDCCNNGGGDAPDFGITNQALYEKLRTLVKAEGQIMYNTKLADLGYPDNLQYQNATIVWDRNAPDDATADHDGNFIFLNSKYCKLRPYLGYNTAFKQTPVETLYSQGVFAYVKLLQWCGNLSCSKPQRIGMLSAKTT